ncbi:MAG: hypothetical protein ACM3MG_13200 [Bacillota bacterium]
MKNQNLYRKPETKKAAQIGKESGRKPKKANKKLGAHHSHEPKEEEE